MGFEEVTDLGCDIVYKLGGTNNKTNKPEPKNIEGYYLGFRLVTTPTGEAKIHVFQTPKGNIGIWGSKEVNEKLNQVVVGTMTRVEHTGKRNLAGGKTLHTYNVKQDKSNTLEVSASGYGTESDDSDDNGSDNFVNASDNEVDEDAEQAAAWLAAEKQAKVQAILNRGKNTGKRN